MLASHAQKCCQLNCTKFLLFIRMKTFYARFYHLFLANFCTLNEIKWKTFTERKKNQFEIMLIAKKHKEKIKLLRSGEKHRLLVT